MSADIIEFYPRKAKWIAEKYINTGKAPIAKYYKENSKEFSKFVDDLNVSSDRVYEDTFVSIYQQYYKNDYTNQHKHIKEEFDKLMLNLKYKDLKFSDNVIQIGDCDLESILYSLEKYKKCSFNDLPEYEKAILGDLQRNSKPVLESLKVDADAIWEYMETHKDDIMKLSTGKTYMTYIMRIRETLLEYAKLVNSYCT